MTRRTRIIGAAVVGGLCAGSLLGFVLSSGGDTKPTQLETNTSTTSTTTSSTTTTTAAPASTTTTTTTAPPVVPTVAPAVPSATTPGPAPTPSPVTPAAPNADPATVMRNFITGYMSWTWSDQPDPNVAVRTRVRPWVTDALDARLGSSSSAAYATSLRVAAHEVDTVEIASLDPTEPDTFLALVSVTITKDGAAPTKRATYITARVMKVGDGWFVNELVH